jgi:transcriptional regulator with XRE-family HTH domain
MYIILMESQNQYKIGEIIKKKRVSIPLTLYELSSNSGVSQSHIGRIERGERLPSARVLRKIAEPLGFEEEELFIIAGFLSCSPSDQESLDNSVHHQMAIDPFVANLLSHETIEVQRAVIGVLSLIKSIAKASK